MDRLEYLKLRRKDLWYCLDNAIDDEEKWHYQMLLEKNNNDMAEERIRILEERVKKLKK